MNNLDQYAQGWVEGRHTDDNHWIASQIVAEEFLNGLKNGYRIMWHRKYDLWKGAPV